KLIAERYRFLSPRIDTGSLRLQCSSFPRTTATTHSIVPLAGPATRQIVTPGRIGSTRDGAPRGGTGVAAPSLSFPGDWRGRSRLAVAARSPKEKAVLQSAGIAALGIARHLGPSTGTSGGLMRSASTSLSSTIVRWVRKRLLLPAGLAAAVGFTIAAPF